MVLEKLSQKWLFTVVNALVVVAIVVAGLVLARDGVKLVLRSRATQMTQPAADGQGDPVRRRTFDYYSPLLKDNMFGFSSVSFSALSSTLDAPHDAMMDRSRDLDIKLLGTVAWPGGEGYAFIYRKDAVEVFRTGQTIPDSGELRSVDATGAVIVSNGEEIRIKLAELSNGKQFKPRKKASAKAAGNGFARKTSETSYIVNQSAVEASLANPKRMLTDARLMPNIVNGKQVGFRISEVKKSGIYHTLGLRNGDVLLRVNEFDISSAETGLQAFTALQGMDRIDLDILRSGNKMSLTYLIR